LTRIAEEQGIPCDGVVWRINDNEEGLKRGRTVHHFKNAVAWKPANIEVETELLDIELSMGRTGVLTPVAIFKPVELLGSVIEKASLHNVSIMNKLFNDKPPVKGQKIWVYKANLIIPQISRVEDKYAATTEDYIFNPTEKICCPYCGEPVEIITSESGVENIVCVNSNCNSKTINILDHFCGDKGIKINGLSKKTLEKLLDWGYITRLSDIFRLSRYRTDWISKDGFGPASVDRILTRIDETRKHIKLESFISGLAIPLVGKTVSKTIAKEFDSWQDFRDYVDTDDCFFDMFDGIGEEINNSIKNFDYTEADECAGMLTFEQNSTSVDATPVAAIQGKTFVITGKLSRKRDDIKAEIESLGGKVTGSVSSKTDYLICNDKNSTTGKSADAKKLGIKIITENEYINLKS
jgi:DNA ligase (NAD+)